MILTEIFKRKKKQEPQEVSFTMKAAQYLVRQINDYSARGNKFEKGHSANSLEDAVDAFVDSDEMTSIPEQQFCVVVQTVLSNLDKINDREMAQATQKVMQRINQWCEKQA